MSDLTIYDTNAIAASNEILSSVSKSADIVLSAKKGQVLAVPVITTADLSIDNSLLSNMPNNPYLLDTSGITAARAVQVGDGTDTPANAAAMMGVLGLKSVGQGSIIEFNLVSTQAGFALSLTSGAGTLVNVQMKLAGGAAAASVVMAPADSSPILGSGIIRVHAVATNVTSGAEVIVFNVIQGANIA